MLLVREATACDVSAMHVIRLRVRENRLSDPSVITEQDYHDFMARDTGNWICEVDGTTIGFAMVDVEKRNLWALFVTPEHEFKGVGRLLHATMLAWYFERAPVLRLTTGPNTRAEAFYRKAGYKETGTTPSGEVILELGRSA
ncbi:MAG: GNAT family N-acetyltransferase [Flavobacteriales bacterium]|nr:GNAT family N-acetyltransferase [Flavobacteriales bacterium]